MNFYLNYAFPFSESSLILYNRIESFILLLNTFLWRYSCLTKNDDNNDNEGDNSYNQLLIE